MKHAVKIKTWNNVEIETFEKQYWDWNIKKQYWNWNTKKDEIETLKIMKQYWNWNIKKIKKNKIEIETLKKLKLKQT